MIRDFLARKLLTSCAAVALALAVGVSTVVAQDRGPGGFGGFGGMGGRGDMMNASISARDLERFTKMMNLDKDQQEAAKLLFESYQEQFKAKSDPVRAAMEKARADFRENRDPSVWQDIRGQMEKFRPIREEMEKTFLSDVKSVLREDQAANFPKFERALRRGRTLQRGLMSGERVDLIGIVERVELPDDTKAQLTPILDQYEIDLDRELVARTTFQETNMPRMGEMFQGGDMKAMQEMMEKGREISVRVRDVNRRYARQIEGLLPEDKRPSFETEVKRQSFPRVYQTTRVSRMLDSVSRLKDLNDTQMADFTVLRQNYDRDLNAVNDQLAQATEKNEMTITADQLMAAFRGGDEGPLSELYQKRRQLGQTAEDNLKKILTPEQMEKLPKPDEDDGRGGRRRGRDGEDPRPQRAAPRAEANPTTPQPR